MAASHRCEGLVLFVLLVIAAGARLSSVHFGLPALNDPDELTFQLGALHMLRGPLLNPGWFGHPATTTMYVLAVVTVGVFGIGHLLGWFPTVGAFANAIYANPTWVMLPGRVMMVFFSLGTIYLTYRLGSKLFCRRTGLAAAALLAFNPVHITWSQIIRSDMMACFFMLLGVLAAVRIARDDRWRDHVLAALWIGAAMATKWPYAVTALAVCGAVALRVTACPGDRWRNVMRLMLVGAMSLGFLFLISPYLLLDYQTASRNMVGEAQQYDVRHLGATAGAPWENAWWYLQGPLRAGLSFAGLGLATGGLLIFARRRETLAVVMPVILGFTATLCFQSLVWERWAISLMPLLAIAAAAALTRLAAYAGSKRAAASAVLLGLTLAPLVVTSQADARARLNDTRQIAGRWAKAHVAPGSTVMIEHFAFDLISEPWRFLFPLGDAGCADAKALLSGKVQLSAVEQRRGARTNVDYGTVAPDMRKTCHADYAILTQYDRYAAEHTAFPVEYGAYRDLIAHGRVVASFAPEVGRSSGPVVRIVRFAR